MGYLCTKSLKWREENEKKIFGSGGIRTHASEETGALNQRLRPLGHATLVVAARKEKVRMKQKEWRCGESNPGPLTCEASALPLSYIPKLGFQVALVP
jgi:hypothetical protein|tara:strand:+ start:1838 stop:2131 length:294 start_codon:yes stop_codon:yes gene_type:complete